MPPPPLILTHTWSGALGGKAAGGGQSKPEGASQGASSLTPEMTATVTFSQHVLGLGPKVGPSLWAGRGPCRL